MENEKPMESQELSVAELATIAGGIAVGEPYPGQYPKGDIYNEVNGAIAKQLENIKIPNWKDKYEYSHTYNSESSSS
ncbi:hypothetical protein NIES37_34970 [Tolypothrix tenuis PCC 7101]|uniref:Bacteriocin n=1 Tax=Tolypothrix tenuis PCC 7101 TaxID=231146 RepID=A0A1Z4N1C5_9CYAN|nr:hypothetical protein [Aulosira sp. FACHB-113]BAY99514.1 hypothetical protein NIES37_34970 [Tolypothrix tenuis PCC 7101]BAZ76561.1 hypothetical protein NIES50_51590 [Aulosira laxa NIES-50]